MTETRTRIDTLADRLTEAEGDLAVIADETTAVILANVGKTVTAMTRTLGRDDRDDILADASVVALLRVASAIVAEDPTVDAGLTARESARMTVLDYRATHALTTARESVSPLDWTGDDGSTRDALTAQVPAADARYGWTRRDALAEAIGTTGTETTTDPYTGATTGTRPVVRPGRVDDGSEAVVRTMVSWAGTVPDPEHGRPIRVDLLPGRDKRSWPAGRPAVAPVADALGIPRAGRQSRVAAAVIGTALDRVGAVTRSIHADVSGDEDRARSARWTDRAASTADALASVLPVHPDPSSRFIPSSEGPRFEGIASLVVRTVGPIRTRRTWTTGPDGLASASTARETVAPWGPWIVADDGSPVVLTLAEADAILATGAGDRITRTEDRAADDAAMTLAPLGPVRAESSRRGKRGGGVGGPTTRPGFRPGWPERTA